MQVLVQLFRCSCPVQIDLRVQPDHQILAKEWHEPVSRASRQQVDTGILNITVSGAAVFRKNGSRPSGSVVCFESMFWSAGETDHSVNTRTAATSWALTDRWSKQCPTCLKRSLKVFDIALLPGERTLFILSCCGEVETFLFYNDFIFFQNFEWLWKQFVASLK